MRDNATKGNVRVEDASLRAHRRAQAGYADGAARRPYAGAFDLWSADDQLAYETGRLWVSNLVSAGMTIPDWPPGGPPPRAVQVAVWCAAETVGNCTPGEVMPPNDDPVGLEPGSLAEPRRRGRRR
jgi:hypothetical protein